MMSNLILPMIEKLSLKNGNDAWTFGIFDQK